MENVLEKKYISVAKAKNNAQLLFEEHVEHTQVHLNKLECGGKVHLFQ